MILVRRLAVAVAALAGLVVAVMGLALAVVLGPSGTVGFTARATGPVLLGADVLGAVDVPVTVRAHRGDTADTASTGDGAPAGVFLAAARSGEVDDVVAGARVLRATGTRFPARALDLEPVGSGVLADPSGLDVWRATGRGSLTVAQAGASAVLVVPTGGEQVTVVVTRQHATWFVEALVALVVGLLVVGAAGWWLVRDLGHLIPLRRPRGGGPRPARTARPATPATPAGDGPSDAPSPESRS